MTYCSVLPIVPCVQSYDDKWCLVWGKKTYHDSGIGKLKSYTMSTISARLFKPEKSEDISTISFAMIPGYALFGVASIVFHALRILYDLIVNLKDGRVGDALDIVADDIFNIIRDVCYTPLLMLVALYGVIFSREGRELMGILDLSWHHGVTYENDIRNVLEKLTDEHKDMSVWNLYWTALKTDKLVFYLPWCMQSRGNVKEKFEIDWELTPKRTQELLLEKFNLAPLATPR